MHFATIFMLLLITGAIAAMVVVHRTGQHYGVSAGCHGGHAYHSAGEDTPTGQNSTSYEHRAADEPIGHPQEATPIGASQV